MASFTAMPALDLVPGVLLASCLSSILSSVGGIAGELLQGFLQLFLATVRDMVTLLLGVLAEEFFSTTMEVEECPRGVIARVVYLMG